MLRFYSQLFYRIKYKSWNSYIVSVSISSFKLIDGIENFISSVKKCEGSLLSAGLCSSCERIDLTHGEPGKGAEHEVEQVLANVDHDVLILKDSFSHSFPEKIQT